MLLSEKSIITQFYIFDKHLFQKSLYRMDHSQQDLNQLVYNNFPKIKSEKELTSIIRYLFADPQNVGVKFAKIGRPKADRKSHGIDIGILFKFYENIDKLKLNQSTADSLKKSLESLENKQRLDQFLKQKQNLRFFFIVMFWDKMYLKKQNNLILLKFLNLISHFGALRQTFLEWCDNIPAQYMKIQVQQLHSVIQLQFSKLAPGVVTQQLLHIVKLNIMNICEFLAILFQSNKRVPRLLNEHFVKKNLSQYFKPLDIFKVYLNKSKNFNFVNFPFLLDLDFKYELLRIQSIFEQKINMQKNVENGLRNLLTGNIQYDVNGNFSLQGLVYLHFQINRQNILDDSMEKLGKIKHNLKNPLRIQFIGEEGSDEGGVQNQYFQLITKQIFNPYLDMFLPKNNSRVYWFNGFSFEPPIRFQFVGMLLGLAIYNSVHLDIRFPKMLYKKLLAPAQFQLTVSQLLEELNQIEPEYYRSMKQIMDSHQSLDQLELYFNIETQNFGQKIVQQLVEDGNSIKLSQDNKNQYIYMYCDFLLNKHIQKQFKAFKRGFDRVVDTQLIKMFTPDELQVIICGKEVIDFKQLQAHAQYQGYTKNSIVIRNLWKILNELNLQDKKAFLMFCTGSDRVPLGGMKALKFVVQKHANTSHLPTAHTCFNVLLLPEYQTEEKLRKNVNFILKHNQGFGLI